MRSAIRPHSKRLRRRSSRVSDQLGRPVGGEHDLLAVLVDGVEGVEELLLRPLLVGDELDVVDEQQVDAPVAGAEVVDAPLLDAGDELVGELLAGGVDDALAREAGQDLVADGVHQVRLAEADAAVQEERVVGVAGALGDRQAGGVGQAVGRADDEGAEGVARVEAGAARAARRATDAARLQPDRRRAGASPSAWAACAERPSRTSKSTVHAVAHDAGKRLADQRAVAGLQPVLGEAVGYRDAEAVVVDATRAVSLSQVSKLAGESETCSSPSAARQTCFASIDGNDPVSGFRTIDRSFRAHAGGVGRPCRTSLDKAVVARCSSRSCRGHGGLRHPHPGAEAREA